jgi:CO/xanthine dehydrogenase FAD-binding subunit
MHRLVGYHRPESIEDTVELLRAPGRMILAGGTALRHDGRADPVEVVDLQALGLDGIAEQGHRVRLGATATLQAVSDDPLVPELIRRGARAELPSTLRSLATVGGTVGAAESESVLLAALLVHDADVRFADGRTESLGSVLHDGVAHGSLVVDLAVATGGTTAMASTARTPADVPIVAALARATDDRMHLALTGVAPTPVLVDPGAIEALDPPADFRGSADFRRHLAAVLAARAIEELS